jgi:hypothetical protein
MGIEEGGSDTVTTTGLVTVYTTAVAPQKGVDMVVAVRDALQKLVVVMVGGTREIEESPAAASKGRIRGS